MTARRAVFLDKDGTLIEDVPYNVDPARIVLTPGAGDTLRLLRAAGYALIVVSNQSGVARGLFKEEALAAVERRLRELCAAQGAPLHGFVYCPHLPDGSVARYAVACDCRKPAPGMLLAAARRHGLDLARSWMVGDILDDVEAGNRAGCRTILIDNGHETEWQPGDWRDPDATVPNLKVAAHWILGALPNPVPLTPAAAGARDDLGLRSSRLRSQHDDLSEGTTKSEAGTKARPLAPVIGGKRGGE